MPDAAPIAAFHGDHSRGRHRAAPAMALHDVMGWICGPERKRRMAAGPLFCFALQSPGIAQLDYNASLYPRGGGK